MKRYNTHTCKFSLLMYLFMVSVLTSMAQNTEWIYDCRADKFVTGPDKYIKEGNTLSFRYIHINPFAVNSNLVISGYTENFGTANTLVATLLANATAASTKSATDASTAKSNQKSADSTIKNLVKIMATTRKSHPQTFKKAATDSIKVKGVSDTLALINSLLKSKQVQEDEIRSKTIDITNEQANINDAILLDTVVTDAMKDPGIYDSMALVERVTKASVAFKPENPRETITNVEESLKAINGYLGDIQTAIARLRLINDQIKPLDKTGNYAFDKEIDSLAGTAGKLASLYSADNGLKLLKGVTGTILNYEKLATSTFALPVRKIGQISDDVDTVTDNLKLGDGTVFKSVGPFIVFSYGGNRVNVSLGFAATFGNLNATSYSLVRDANSKVTSISSGRQNSVGNFSPILFVNYIFKTKCGLSPAISAGLNPDFSSLSNSRLLIGGSLALSESNSLLKRILLSGGLGMGFTDCIKPKYIGITDFSTLNSLSDSDLSEKAFRFGGFFGVSFNLSK